MWRVDLAVDDVDGDDRRAARAPTPRCAPTRCARLDRIEQRRVAPRAPTSSTRSSRPPSAQLEPRCPGSATSSTPSSGRCGLPARGRRPRAGPVAERRRGSRARRRGTAPAVRVRARAARRTPPDGGGPSSACASRASADEPVRRPRTACVGRGFARRLPPVCSCCEPAAAHLVGRGAASMPSRAAVCGSGSTHRTVPARWDRTREPPGIARVRSVHSAGCASRSAATTPGYPLKQHLVGC